MSVVMQIGQCGNQLGEKFFHTLSEEISHAKPNVQDILENSYFIPPSKPGGVPIARAVLVDMEPKVVRNCLQGAARSGTWKYDNNSSFCKQSGSANNWAHGFNTHGPACRESILECVRRQVEACDMFVGFQMMQSLAGGTGSGLGAFICEMLREEFPSASILNNVIWPYESGEVIVQNYNSLLTLSSLLDSSDAVCIVENDVMQRICVNQLNIKRPSFGDINAVIARHLVGAIFPGRTTTRHSMRSIIRHLCSHPSYKLLTVRCIPQVPQSSIDFTSDAWSALLKRLLQMLMVDHHTEEGLNWRIKLDEGRTLPESVPYNRSISNWLVLQGKESETASFDQFAHPKLYPSWALDPLSVTVGSHMLGKQEKTATLLSNSQSILRPLDRLTGRAYEMFAANAYLHQYEKHGLLKTEFVEHFAHLEQSLQNYRLLST
eukprot:GILJ01009599.1.p1 GENE.GILJ01009599.1~~GILJ01009599.1.p1  ORF type:complete len:434 (+),score=41.07 GILJ01009599.1:58-1359(+)